MTHSSPVPVTAELEQHFQRALRSDDNTRWIQVQISDEQLVEGSSGNSSGSMANDYNSMSSKAGDEACYFLFKLNASREWLLLTYVPDSVSIKNKMLMASAKGTLKDKLGYGHFVDEAHATKLEELSYEHYQTIRSNTDSRSQDEIAREEMHKQEEIERQEQQQKPRPKTVGYHSVIIPLSDQAEQTIQRFKSGSINFIIFDITEDKTAINANGKSVSSNQQVEREINTSEPRFYIYNVPNKSPVFIYCCPERSPPRLRMVYSTSKPTVAEQIEELGVNLASKKIEIREPSDLADELRTDFNRSTSTIIKPSPTSQNQAALTGRLKGGSNSEPDMGGMVKASKLPTFQHEHPIYALMSKGASGGGGSSGPSVKKKIVIPPPGAWN